jgi:hypothetical protein
VLKKLRMGGRVEVAVGLVPSRVCAVVADPYPLVAVGAASDDFGWEAGSLWPFRYEVDAWLECRSDRIIIDRFGRLIILLI